MDHVFSCPRPVIHHVRLFRGALRWGWRVVIGDALSDPHPLPHFRCLQAVVQGMYRGFHSRDQWLITGAYFELLLNHDGPRGWSLVIHHLPHSFTHHVRDLIFVMYPAIASYFFVSWFLALARGDASPATQAHGW